MSFNVYLSPFDVWTGALVPSVSLINGHDGEPSLSHLTTDTSCAPFLIKSGQEFFPFELDTDLDFDNLSMERSRQGYIEVIEMATFNGLTIPAADHGTVGVPSDWTVLPLRLTGPITVFMTHLPMNKHLQVASSVQQHWLMWLMVLRFLMMRLPYRIFGKGKSCTLNQAVLSPI